MCLWRRPGKSDTTLAWGALFPPASSGLGRRRTCAAALIKDSPTWGLLKEFFPPNFHDWRVYLVEMVIHDSHRHLGHRVGCDLRLPCGLLSAENLVPKWCINRCAA